MTTAATPEALKAARQEAGRVVDLVCHDRGWGFRDDLIAVIAPLIAARDAAREEACDQKLAAAGGEDVPGSANAVTAEDVRRWRDEDARLVSTATAEAASLRAEVEALKAERDSAEAKVTAYREAIRVMAEAHRAAEAAEQRENERLRRHPITRGTALARAATAGEGRSDA